MQASTLFIIIVGLSIFGYIFGQGRALALAKPLGGIRKLHSLPSYYAAQAALFCGLPAMVLMGVWLTFDQALIDGLVMSRVEATGIIASNADYNLTLNRVHNIASGILPRDGQQAVVLAAADHLNTLRSNGRWALTVLSLALAGMGLVFGVKRIRANYRARATVERVMSGMLMSCALLAIFTTVGILLSVVFESIHFFRQVPISEFIFGTSWSPQTAIRADQVGSSGSFGAVPLFTGTLLISAVAMFVAVPVGLMSAIYLAEYASRRTRTFVKPTLEILAGIPTVVYGFFAALTVAPFIRNLGESLGMDVSSESALAAGSVMGVMIIPFISSLADDVITAVPQTMRDGSLALGATKSETIRKVVIPAALPGIVGGVLLALSRAIGETMIVVMAAGMAANLTANPLETVTTVTVQIVTLLTGDQEFDSAKTLAAFALGLMLFLVTLMLNIVALRVVKKYREQYE